MIALCTILTLKIKMDKATKNALSNFLLYIPLLKRPVSNQQ